MNRGESRELEIALAAADSAVLVASPAQAAEAAKAWGRSRHLGLDTEFVRERTYHANIGLVQVSDGRTVGLLDPLADGTLPPLADLLNNPDIVKLVHSPSEDYEVLLHAAGTLPDPVFDTQIACALLGQPLQMGYHMAAEWLLGVAVDKGQTRSNWCARPLRPAQLRYAALDVCLLPLMWRRLEAALREQDRLDWFIEDCTRQAAQAQAPQDVASSWQRIRGDGRLDGESLAVLQRLAEWREQEARRRNRPRGFIIPDRDLLEIAVRKMTTVEDLNGLGELHPRARQRYGATVTRLVSKTLDSGEWIEPVKPLTTRQRKLLRRLRDRVKEVADELGIEPAVLAPKKDLEELVQLEGSGRVPERLEGWRMQAVTNELLTMLGGES